jgi:hypothetical protein
LVPFRSSKPNGDRGEITWNGLKSSASLPAPGQCLTISTASLPGTKGEVLVGLEIGEAEDVLDRVKLASPIYTRLPQPIGRFESQFQ